MIALRDFTLGLAVQFLNYLNLVVNYRAIAHRQIAWAIATDALASALAYVVIRRVGEAKNHWMLFGMILGGALASAVGILLTQAWG